MKSNFSMFAFHSMKVLIFGIFLICSELQGKMGEVTHSDPVLSAEAHFSLAQAYSSDGNADGAIEEYKLALMYDSHSALLYSRLATEYVKKGMFSLAMETCKEALQRDPNYLDARLILAGLYSTSHESKAALKEYDRVLKIDPKHEEAAVFKSQVLIEDGHIAEAAQSLRQFIKHNPQSALSYYYLGRTEQQQDHFKGAVEAYQTAIALKPNFSQANLALGFLYEEKGMNIQAIAIYRNLFEDGQDASAASRLAMIYLKEEKYQQSILFLEAIQAADPDDLNVRVKLGLVHMELKHFDQAITIFKSILDKNPDADRIHYYLGSLYEETKQLDLAIAELKLIQTESNLYSDAALHVTYLLKLSNQLPEAKTFIKNAISKAPKNPSFYLFQASLEEDSKELQSSIHILQKAVQQFPDDEKVRYYLGSLYDRLGQVDKGLEQMEAILKVNPENVDALNYIGYTWTLKGIRLNDAEKLLKRALGLRPDNGYIQDSWGWYLFIRGRVQEAVVELEKAAKLKPNEATILEHLGDAYLRSNLREKALNRYKSAVEYADDENAKLKIQAKANTLSREIGEVQVRAPAHDHASH